MQTVLTILGFIIGFGIGYTIMTWLFKKKY